MIRFVVCLFVLSNDLMIHMIDLMIQFVIFVFVCVFSCCITSIHMRSCEQLSAFVVKLFVATALQTN